MLVLYYPRIGSLPVCIIDDRITLEVVCVKKLRLKSERSVLKSSLTVVIVCVNRPCEYHLSAIIRKVPPVKEIRVGHNVAALKKLVYNDIVAALGNSLISVVKVIVVIYESYGKPLYYKGGKVLTVSSPLLFSVTFYQFSVYILSHKAYGLLLKIFGLVLYGLSLSLYLCSRLIGSPYAPHLVEGIHIEGKIIALSVVVGNR